MNTNANANEPNRERSRSRGSSRPRESPGQKISPPKPPKLYAFLKVGNAVKRYDIGRQGVKNGKKYIQTRSSELVKEAMARGELRRGKYGELVVATSDEDAFQLGQLPDEGKLEHQERDEFEEEVGEDALGEDGTDVEAGEEREEDGAGEVEDQALNSSESAIVSFFVNNGAVTLQKVRDGAKRARELGPVKAKNLYLLGLSSVGSTKEVWATTLKTVLIGMGPVPLVFAGAGGVYKAFLMLGYDILKHLSMHGDRSRWPDWLVSGYSNAERVCPGGNIMNAMELPDNGEKKVKDRNAAIRLAKTAFLNWQPDPTLKYLETLMTVTAKVTASTALGSITAYKKGK